MHDLLDYQPTPPGSSLESGGCGATAEPWWHEFGAAGGGGSNSDGGSLAYHVPGAASVRLLFDDGTSRPLPIAHEWTVGWYSVREAHRHPVLVGYDAAGAEIGRVVLQH